MTIAQHMGRRLSKIAFCGSLWLSILGTEYAWAQIYRWTDRQGVVHFTDNPSRIPTPYQSSVQVEPSLPPPGSQELSADHATTALKEEVAPAEPTSSAPRQDRLGRGPDYWRGLAQQWSTQLQSYVQERERLQLLADYTRHLANATRDVWDRARLEAEATKLEMALAEVERHIQEAQAMLQTTLPLEAVRLGADPEWLKPPIVTRP